MGFFNNKKELKKDKLYTDIRNNPYNTIIK